MTDVSKKKSTIQMAAEYSVGSTLIIGKPQTGRTSLAIKRLVGKKVLWLSCNNLGVIATCETLGEGSVLKVISKWQQLLDAASALKPKEYDAVVIDGLNNAKDFWFSHNFTTPDAIVRQADWQNMSKDLSKLIVDFRDKAVVYAIVDIEKTADENKVVDGKTVKVDGRNDMALNLDAQKRVTGLFDDKIQTVIKTEYIPNPQKGTLDAQTVFGTLTGAAALNYN